MYAELFVLLKRSNFLSDSAAPRQLVSIGQMGFWSLCTIRCGFSLVFHFSAIVIVVIVVVPPSSLPIHVGEAIRVEEQIVSGVMWQLGLCFAKLYWFPCGSFVRRFVPVVITWSSTAGDVHEKPFFQFGARSVLVRVLPESHSLLRLLLATFLFTQTGETNFVKWGWESGVALVFILVRVKFVLLGWHNTHKNF